MRVLGEGFVSAAVFLSAALATRAIPAAQNGSGPSSAEEFQSNALASKVLNLNIVFHWIAGSDRFWFGRQTQSRTEVVVVDAATGLQSAVFDVVTMRAALNAAHAGAGEGSDLPISSLTFGANDSSLIAETPNGFFACKIPLTTCTERSAPWSKDLVVSPDGQRALVRHGDQLWLRDLTSGNERRLTSDGEPGFGYGDIDRWEDNLKVARRLAGTPSPLLGALWSGNGRFVVALRQDLRPFPNRLLVTEYLRPDGTDPITHSLKIGMPLDPTRPDSRLVAIDTRTWAVRPVALDSQALNDWALPYFTRGVVWWGKYDPTLFVMSANRGGTRYALSAIDLATGHVREILHETAQFFVRLNPDDYSRPNVWVSSKGDEIIWYSERSGYGHLYLYDAISGRVKRQLTRGDWVVFDLLRVDEAKRLVYFTAGPRVTGGNPYYRYLYSVSLDGGVPKLLTPETADHDFNNPFGVFLEELGPGGPAGSRISPSGRYFVDSFSTTSEPPKVVLRRTTGELIAKVISSDASALYAAGWKPPERVTAKASDSSTDLYGVLFTPQDFDPSRRYPVVEFTYPAPQTKFAPVSFKDDIAGFDGRIYWPLVKAGFIVVALDGRGATYRSRSFRDAFLGTEDVFGAADHVAAIRNLAKQRSYMDLERVGITGDSFGGYGSLRATLLYPDFFKVCVAADGPSDFYQAHEPSVERLFGVPTASREAYAHFESIKNTWLASSLKGHVLLIYGGIDENVPVKNAFAQFDAFIQADKDVDMLFMPNWPHGAFSEPYALRRTVEYFVQHLGGATH